MKKKLLATLLITCVGCGAQGSSNEDTQEEKPLDYDVAEKDEIKWSDVFLKPEERYLVYFYSPYCGYCRQIKEEVLSYYIKEVEKIYFVDSIKENAVYDYPGEGLIGVNCIEDFYIPGTPSLVEISSYTVTNLYVGVDNIRLYLN